MLLQIPDVLSPEQVAACRAALADAPWVDGNATSGHQSFKVKHNHQLAEGSPLARRLGDMVLDALGRHPLFISAALPLKVYPPLFNRYEGGQTFGTHVDNAIRQLRGSDFRVRADLSATLFLTDPADYDGGELVLDTTFGVQRVKLPAGHLVLYPASSLHQVTPVTRGARVSSFFWIQSMVRDDGERALLFELDNAIRGLGGRHVAAGSGAAADPSSPRAAAVDAVVDAQAVSLTGVYHNLLRRWADS
jgi:PKHD-type hydroxylase